MQISNAPRTATRPQVKRMSQRELQETKISTDLDSTTMSMSRWQNRTQTQVAPETYNSWNPTDTTSRNPQDDIKNKCFLHRGWLWLFGGIFCLILIVAIIAVVLGIVLPMATTASPDGNATPKMGLLYMETSTTLICSNTNRGSIAFLNKSIPTAWTFYSYNYSAITTTPTLLFGFETSGTHVYYLDNVSIVDNQTPSIELLNDSNFENTTTNTTDWIRSCETDCSSQIISDSECFGGSGNCFMLSCPVINSSISFISQSFVATIGNTYTISFMLHHVGFSNTGISSFYVDVI